MSKIRLLLVDDHAVVRSGLRMLLEAQSDMEIVGEAANGLEAVELSKAVVPDVILMDIKMPGVDGIEATRLVLHDNPHIGIILVTMFDDVESVFSAMRAGARGYVLKEAEPEELRRAIEAAGRGEFILCPIIAERVLQHFSSENGAKRSVANHGELTEREMEVLRSAAQGLSNKEIADHLNISAKTVKNHIANIFSKLQVNDRTQAILLAVKRGIISI